MAAAHRDVAGLLSKHGYQQLKKIGEGSFGKAILVQEKEGSKMVCKMVDVSKASRKEQEDAVKEGKLLASLKHPYIVRYRESFHESGWLCILMDYCEGGDLTRQINKAKSAHKSIDEDQCLRWQTQALLALKYCHDKHILHRDLKPGNFFLSRHHALKMGDFGIARVLSCTVACAKTQIGTPYYMSPEVCLQKPYAWASDIWAMGCILFELCALKVPFDATSISALVQKIIKGPIPLVPTTYTPFTRQLCAEILSRNPHTRPSAEDILKRPQIRCIVEKMLEEARDTDSPHGGGSGGKAAAPPSRAPSPGAGPSRGPSPSPSPAPAVSQYKKGDLLEYHSATHKDWLPCTVFKVDAAGRITIDLKPNTWMSREEQAVKVRFRKAKQNKGAAQAQGVGARQPQPPKDAGPPNVGGRPLASPMRARSPSVGRDPSAGPVERPAQGAWGAKQPVSRQGSPRAAAAAHGKDPQTPQRVRSPSPAPGREPSPRSRAPSRAPSPKGGAGGARPPCKPPRAASPLQKRCFAANGAGIVSSN